MDLAAGSRLGPYEIAAPLGAGGMGEVYRARDTRLGRDVALKVLPRDLLADPQLRARFEREARTLAALNHPHIAAIYDVVETGDRRAIVMELVSGRTLTDVMAGGAIPTRLALGYAIDICDALATAHVAGIVHRDLKPANVVVSDTGTVKVLDFGIAKVLGPVGPEGEDQSTRAALTGDRALVGTIGYMSPEQVHGRTVDARSDIFSLGVLLHEMIAGRRAFDADSAAGLLSAVLRDDPPLLRSLVPGVPRSVERVTARCLQKDPRQRYQTATDLKIALEDARDDFATAAGGEAAPSSTEPAVLAAASVAPARAGRRILSRLAYLAAGAAVGAAGLLAAGTFRPTTVLTPQYRPFITEAASATWPVWSPDGKTLAYLSAVDGTRQLFLRGLDASQPTQLTRGPSVVAPFWSPDGTKLYFVRDKNLVSVGMAGGEPQQVVSDVLGDTAGTISPDGRTIVFVRGELGIESLWTVETSTGAVRPLERDGLPSPVRRINHIAFSPDGATLGLTLSTRAQSGAAGVWLLPWPEGTPRYTLGDAPYYTGGTQTFGWMPDSRRIVFSARPAHESASRLFLADTRTGSLAQVTSGTNEESTPSVSPDGTRLAFVSTRAGLDLIEFPLDGSPPVQVIQSSRNESYPDMSRSGLLAYLTDAEGWPGVRVRPGGGAWSRNVMASREAGVTLSEVRLSPDEQRLSVDVLADEHAVWIYPVGGGTAVRLERESTDQHGASWSPDGNWLAYRRLTGDRWELAKAPVGGGAVVRLAEADGGGVGNAGATDWSSTGAWIAHRRPDGIHLVSPDGKVTRVLAGPRPASFRFSRDGTRLLAVRRGEGRRWELATWDVDTGRELRVAALPLAASAYIEGMALSPDESRIIVGAGTPTSDIWLLEQFEPPAPWWSRWLGR